MHSEQTWKWQDPFKIYGQTVKSVQSFKGSEGLVKSHRISFSEAKDVNKAISIYGALWDCSWYQTELYMSYNRIYC